MTVPAPADLQRWSQELARDPSSLAFLPLAQAYRRKGRRDAALRLCLRGLEQHPRHVDAHGLLAVLYLEDGQRKRACDEWATVLSLDPVNFEAHRGMGFFYLEKDDYTSARRHLERAAREKPTDPAVREALDVLRDRQGNGRARPSAAQEREPAQEAALRDPSRVFEMLLDEAPFLGALVLDARGLVLVGTLPSGDSDRAERLGAILGGAVEEAARTTGLLGLGDWSGILLETDRATVHLAPLHDELVVLLAAKHGAPTGWVLRTAARASELARGFLEGGS